LTRSNLIFLVIAIVGILSGLIIALQGISHYPSFQPTELSEKFFQDPQGFLLFSSEDIDTNANSSLNLSLQNFCYQNGTAEAWVRVSCKLNIRSGDDLAYFALQTFGNVTDVSAKVNDLQVGDLNGAIDIIVFPRQTVSYILIEVPKSNLTATVNVGIWFTWQSAILRTSYYGFSTIVSFNLAFPSFLGDVGLPEGAINGNGLLTAWGYFGSPNHVSIGLHIQRSPNTLTLQAIPTPDNQGFSFGSVWYHWDLTSKCHPEKFSSIAVVLDFESNSFKSSYDSRLQTFGIFLGIGIPSQ